MIAEFLIVVMVLVQVIGEIQDIRNIGKKRWWQVLVSRF
jgi:hypothetical protein